MCGRGPCSGAERAGRRRRGRSCGMLAHPSPQDQSELRSSTEKKLLDLEESLTQERRARQEGVEQTHSTLAAEIRRVSDAADARGDERCAPGGSPQGLRRALGAVIAAIPPCDARAGPCFGVQRGGEEAQGVYGGGDEGAQAGSGGGAPGAGWGGGGGIESLSPCSQAVAHDRAPSPTTLAAGARRAGAHDYGHDGGHAQQVFPGARGGSWRWGKRGMASTAACPPRSASRPAAGAQAPQACPASHSPLLRAAPEAGASGDRAADPSGPRGDVHPRGGRVHGLGRLLPICITQLLTGSAQAGAGVATALAIRAASVGAHATGPGG